MPFLEHYNNKAIRTSVPGLEETATPFVAHRLKQYLASDDPENARRLTVELLTHFRSDLRKAFLIPAL